MNHTASEPLIQARRNPNGRSCSKCQRSFCRSDSLLRHMRVHDENRSHKRRQRTACIPCFTSKIKCTGEQPTCASCSRRQIVCIYSSNSRPQLNVLSTATTEQPHTPFLRQLGRRGQLQLDHRLSQTESLRSAEVANLHFTDSMYNVNDSPTSTIGLASSMQTVDLSGSFPIDSQYFLGGTDLNTNLDWLFDGVSTDDTLTFETIDQLGPSPRWSESQARHPKQDITRHNIMDEASSRDAHNLSFAINVQPENTCSPEDPWPMEWYAEYQRPPMDLPILGASVGADAHLASFFSQWDLKSSSINQLAQFLRIPNQRSPWHAVELKHFPSKEQLEHCIDKYFANFHKFYPLIHQPTFDPNKNLALTLVIASIGALYTHFSESRAFSDTLSELNRRLLLFLAEYDRRYVRTEVYLTAQLLQGIHGYCCGNKRLFELSESSRNNLIHQAKCIGLFHHPPKGRHVVFSEMTLEERWVDWIQQEKRNRLGWAIYKYDASVSYLHNSRPFLTVGDVVLDLPCSLRFWTAESAHCWFSMLPSPPLNPKPPNLAAILRTCLDTACEPKDNLKDEEHRYTIVETLSRMLWSLKDMNSSPILDFVPVGPDLLVPPVLRALDIFLKAPNKLHTSLTTEEMARAMYTQQVIHIAHLYGAGNLMNWLFPLLRHGNTATAAQRNLNLWAAQKPQDVRKAAYHSAQILAIARKFPSNSPNEPFIIFYAGAILFYLAKLLSERQPSDQSIIVALDHLASGDDEAAVLKLNMWIQMGEAHRIHLQGTESLCNDTGRRQVLDLTIELLKRRQVWGIADSFVKVIIAMRDNQEYS